MASLNAVHLLGNLTRDPELRTLANGSVLADMTVAVNRQYTDGEGEKQKVVTFVPVTVWSKTAEYCNRYLSKGSLVLCEGRLDLDQWETQEGEKRSRLKVTAFSVQNCGGSRGARERADGPDNDAPPADGGFPMDETGEDLPF